MMVAAASACKIMVAWYITAVEALLLEPIVASQLTCLVQLLPGIPYEQT